MDWTKAGWTKTGWTKTGRTAAENGGKSFAAGADGPLGLLYLTHLFKLSISHCNILFIWTQAIITPFPKRYKPADLGTSYSLFSALLLN